MPLLDDFLIGHELLGPLDRAGADEEHRHAEGETEGDIARAHDTEDRDVDHRLGVDCNEGDDEQDDEEHGEQEHGRDLPLGASRSLRVRVGKPRGVRDLDVAGLLRVVALGEDFTHRALIPIQTAAAMNAAKTAVHRNSPSATGPIRPSDSPPGLPASCSSVM